MTHFALVGPTGSGKSSLALGVARTFGDVEIVSVDSMQVYRGLDIGTAKPSPAERAAVPHHLVDVADPDEDWSVARFQAAARASVADIEARGRRALLVGGTGLYVHAVVDALAFPAQDPTLRAELEARTATAEGLGAAYAELARLDPVAAARIVPGNRRRVVRALEVIRLTGRAFSSTGPGIQRFGRTVFPVRLAGVWLPRPVLARRLAARLAQMREAGLADEVRGLLLRGTLSRTARQAIGYKELLAYVDGEEPSLDRAFDQALRRTRAFARRQRMWFRRDPRITWLGAGENPDVLLAPLLATWSR